MKQCDKCRMQLDDRTVTCPYCGSTELSALAPRANPLEIEEKGAGNVVAGAVGAFLFSLIGGALYFIVYQLGYISGICGLVIFVLANFGYHLFAKGEKDTAAGLVTAVIMTVLMILLAELVSIAYQLRSTLQNDYGVEMTIFEAFRLTLENWTNPDVIGDVVKELLMAYGFSVIGIIGSISNRRKAKKRAAAMADIKTETETPTV